MDKKAMEVYAAIGSRVRKKPKPLDDGSSSTSAMTAGDEKPVKAGEGGKRSKKKKNPPPPGYKRLSSSDEFVRISRAQDEEIAALAQKEIDRDAEMRRQYEIQGYADIEFTDVEDEELDEDWRPWAYRKAAGLVD
ncbi:unnamed protein product [Urochloa decumbens]|uniref:Uncharacterized protein n=1 Tax=Urochloa decumbens TaxID=240449 RepID=A0ABC9B937_9POAL